MPTTPYHKKPRATRWAKLVYVGLVGLTGCVAEQHAGDGDPMAPGAPIPQNKATLPPTTAPTASNTLPDIPATQAIAPASLTSGSGQSLPPSSDKAMNLGISGNAATPPTPAPWQPGAVPVSQPQPQPTDPLLNSNPPPVHLQGPTTTVSNTVPITPGSIPSSPNRVDTYADLQKQLADLGAVSQQLRQVGENGIWEFRCSVPDPHTPGIYNVTVVTAAGESGLAAMRGAVQKILADRQP